MKKVWMIAAALTAVLLTGCQCKHEEWKEADCENPKTCVECGVTEGEALGHDWKDATCETPKTCKECGVTEGEPAEHVWKEATCEEPKHCENCDATEGEVLGHTWKDADCENPKKCTVCYKTEGKEKGHTYDPEPTCTEGAVCKVCKQEKAALGHSWINATCTKPKTCVSCDVTEGEALGHTYKNGACSKCGEEQKILIYDDSYVSVYYTGINCSGSVDLYLYAENKSSLDLGITIEDPSIDGSMVYFGGYMDVSAGKNAKNEFYFNLTSEYGAFYSADTIEFKLNINDDETYHTIVETSPITIDVKNGKVTSMGGGSGSGGSSGGSSSGGSSSGDSSSGGSSSGSKSIEDVEAYFNGLCKEIEAKNNEDAMITSYKMLSDHYQIAYLVPDLEWLYKNDPVTYTTFVSQCQEQSSSFKTYLDACGFTNYHVRVIIGASAPSNSSETNDVTVITIRDGEITLDMTDSYYN